MTQTRHNLRCAAMLILGLIFAGQHSLNAQEPTPVGEVDRAQTIIAAELAKASRLRPGEPPHGEQVFDKVESHLLDQIFLPNGFNLKLGGLPSGGGFALGPRYTRHDLLRNRLSTDSSVVGSTKKWWRAESSLETNPFFNHHLTLRTEAAYENAASMPFYGEGADSAHKETNFRREFTTVHFAPLLHFANGQFTAGYSPGGLLVNVGPGDRDVSPSTDTAFTGVNVPGLNRQSNFVTGTAMVELNKSHPTFSNLNGFRLEATDTQFWDRSNNNASFHLLQTQGTFGYSFLNGMRTIMVRVRNESTFHSSEQTVPFYLQPTLGGPDDLRGYDRYRYYGNNSSIVTGEYRWSVAGTLEMAFFADGGDVYSRAGLIGLRDFKGDGGVGFRVKNKQETVMRFDIGVSPEGVKAWFVFNPAFGRLFHSY